MALDVDGERKVVQNVFITFVKNGNEEDGNCLK
jgi:hypothetical protein